MKKLAVILTLVVGLYFAFKKYQERVNQSPNNEY
ncbi:SE2200 family small protein [Staphylococcus aureus]|nr:SE2200 family small protein [Staphylococcus aureus]